MVEKRPTMGRKSTIVDEKAANPPLLARIRRRYGIRTGIPDSRRYSFASRTLYVP
jgi:hypothetical protein